MLTSKLEGGSIRELTVPVVTAWSTEHTNHLQGRAGIPDLMNYGAHKALGAHGISASSEKELGEGVLAGRHRGCVVRQASSNQKNRRRA